MPHFFPEEAAFFETEGRLFGRRFPFSSSDDSKNTTRHNTTRVPSSLPRWTAQYYANNFFLSLKQRVRVEVSTRTLRPLSRIEHHVSSLVQDEEDTGRRKNEQQMGEFEHGQTVVGVFFAHRRRFDREIDVRTREVRARAPPDFHW